MAKRRTDKPIDPLPADPLPDAPSADTAESAEGQPVATIGEAADSRGGRPRGAKTADRPEAVLLPAQCPGCKSTRRAAFRDGPAHTQTAAVEIQGQVFTRQIWRNTKCLDCGQKYRVIEYRRDK